MKQDELDGNLELMVIVGLGGKLSRHWKKNKRKFWQWRRVYKAYRNCILESDVGQTNYDNRRKACRSQVVSTTKGGMVWNMD